LLGEEESPLPKQVDRNDEVAGGIDGAARSKQRFVAQVRPRVESGQQNDIVTGALRVPQVM